MDPTANLTRIRAVLSRLQDHDATGADPEAIPELQIELEDLVGALDAWISNGGALPTQWLQRHQQQRQEAGSR